MNTNNQQPACLKGLGYRDVGNLGELLLFLGLAKVASRQHPKQAFLYYGNGKFATFYAVSEKVEYSASGDLSGPLHVKPLCEILGDQWEQVAHLDHDEIIFSPFARELLEHLFGDEFAKQIYAN